MNPISAVPSTSGQTVVVVSLNNILEDDEDLNAIEHSMSKRIL